jgi:RNA polymerase sigma-70 factor (ECF subfamily)
MPVASVGTTTTAAASVLSKIASAFFSGIFPPFFPDKLRSGFHCAEPGGHTFLFHANLFWRWGNNPIVRWFTLVCVSEERSLSGSFEELALPLFERLYNFAQWLTQDRQEAEDLVQETYAKALRGFGSFRPGTNFRAWMYQILRNTFLTSRSGLKSTATVSLELESDQDRLPATKETPESILLQRSDRQLVQEALGQLPVPYREVLLLCEFEEMSYQEISATLAIPMGTVMSRLSRARRALRDAVQQLQGTE